MTTDVPSADPREGVDAEERWYLSDEREFLIRSLADAEREHGAGDLAQADYEVLLARDQRRLAEVETELGSLLQPVDDGAAVDPPVATEGSGKSEWRRVGIIASCFLIVAGAVILVDHALSPRLPGQSSSGSITVPKAQLIEQQLAEALQLNNKGEVVAALQVYENVLGEDPNDPEALAAAGWLEWNSGFEANVPELMTTGRKLETTAVRVAPSFYGGHLFLGLILLNQDHNATGAVTQFNEFLADHPPTTEVHNVASLIRTAYTQAGMPVPSSLSTPSG
jgi:tetratricopeptide (TPR) repeat protein